MTDQAWLTVKEYAAMFRYHPNTVYRKVARGEIAGVVKHGRDIRIPVPPADEPSGDSLSLSASQRVSPTP